MRMSAELDVMRQLQQMMSPRPQEMSQIQELDIAGFMEPASEVGADYYDVLQLEGKVKIGIGDVTAWVSIGDADDYGPNGGANPFRKRLNRSRLISGLAEPGDLHKCGADGIR